MRVAPNPEGRAAYLSGVRLPGRRARAIEASIPQAENTDFSPAGKEMFPGQISTADGQAFHSRDRPPI